MEKGRARKRMTPLVRVSASAGEVEGGWIAEDENGDLGEAGVEFGNEGRTADAQHGMRGDDESELGGELGLLDEAEGFGSIGDANDIEELAFQDRFPQKSLERVAFHD